MVECCVANAKVEGSNPFFRSLPFSYVSLKGIRKREAFSFQEKEGSFLFSRKRGKLSLFKKKREAFSFQEKEGSFLFSRKRGKLSLFKKKREAFSFFTQFFYSEEQYRCWFLEQKLYNDKETFVSLPVGKGEERRAKKKNKKVYTPSACSSNG